MFETTGELLEFLAKKDRSIPLYLRTQNGFEGIRAVQEVTQTSALESEPEEYVVLVAETSDE